MDFRVIGMIAAGVGVVASIVWIVLAVGGLRVLRDIREELRKRSP
jgi:hypothetical protein